MQFSLGVGCTVACRNGPAGLRRAGTLGLRSTLGLSTRRERPDGVWLQCHVSPEMAKERLFENGLDPFKMIDNAPSSSLGRFRRRLIGKAWY
jgi:hypothetical protein